MSYLILAVGPSIVLPRGVPWKAVACRWSNMTSCRLVSTSFKIKYKSWISKQKVMTLWAKKKFTSNAYKFRKLNLDSDFIYCRPTFIRKNLAIVNICRLKTILKYLGYITFRWFTSRLQTTSHCEPFHLW